MMAAPRGTLYRIEIIEEVRQQLRCLPEPKIAAVSKLEVVRALAPDIEELQKAGHTIETIASTLSGLGVQLTKATLRTYLGKLRPAGQRGRRRSRQQAGDRPTPRLEPTERPAASHPTASARTERNARNDMKENRSVSPPERSEKVAALASAPGDEPAASTARTIPIAQASHQPEGFEARHNTTEGNNGREAPADIAHGKSEKPTVRGAATPAPGERPPWSFVPRQDSNDI